MNIRFFNNLGNKITIRNLSIFILVVVISGWIGHWLDTFINNQETETPGMGLWLITPSIFALLLRIFAKDGWKDFGLKPNLKGNIRWYLISLLAFPVIITLTILIGKGLGLISTPTFSISTVGVFAYTFLLGLLPMFIKNIFEEFAWRGYLAPKVYSLNINIFIGHLIVGFIWAIWHLPYYLFFLDQNYIQEFTTLSLPMFLFMVLITYLSWAIVFGELRLLTNSVWPTVLIHMVEDAFLIQLFTEKHIIIAPNTDWLVSPMSGLISIILFLLLGIWLGTKRKSKMSAVYGNT